MGLKVWLDGICKDCGCIVVEMPSSKDKDYMNTCTNPKCKNFGWHHNYDMDCQEYYEHEFNLDNIPHKL
jgi:hypothetical protein